MNIGDAPSSCGEKIRLHIPERLRRGVWKKDERKSVESAVENLKRIAYLTGRPVWENLDILDYGCGVKFTQALLQYDIDVKSYTGVDVAKEIIRHLQRKVKKPNFHFYDVPFQNAFYNPHGVKLDADSELFPEKKSWRNLPIFFLNRNRSLSLSLSLSAENL